MLRALQIYLVITAILNAWGLKCHFKQIKIGEEKGTVVAVVVVNMITLFIIMIKMFCPWVKVLTDIQPNYICTQCN